MISTVAGDKSLSRLLDLEHYAVAARQRFASREEALAHFVKVGQSQGLSPSPYFYTDWYRWQNPDYRNYASVIHHFAEKARSTPIDPSPFIDSVKLMRKWDYGTALDAYNGLVEDRHPEISPRLSDHLADLNDRRNTVHEAIRSTVLRDDGGRRDRLVWVQAGSSFKLAEWFCPDQPRTWDLMCNWYSLSKLDLRFGERHIRQSGTKSTGIHHVLSTYPHLLDQYEQVLFIDDDLVFDFPDLDKVFKIARNNSLDLFQPSLRRGSHCMWADLFQKRTKGFRNVSGVEVMMYGFSKRALARCASFFGRSVSGFGLDLRCSEVVRAEGWRCAVIDEIAAGHMEPIDEQGGSYYEFMRALGINQKLELFETIIELDRLPTFVDISSSTIGNRANFRLPETVSAQQDGYMA